MLVTIDWNQDPGEIWPDDNPTPMLFTSMTPADKQHYLYDDNAVIYQCTHNSIGNRKVTDGVAARTPIITRVALTAASALQETFNSQRGKEITVQSMSQHTDEDDFPLAIKTKMYRIQSIRTIIYWADRNRREAKAREKAIQLTAASHSLDAPALQRTTKMERTLALTTAVQATEQKWPERLHPQAQNSLDMAIEELDQRLDNEHDAATYADHAVAYLIAHSLRGKPTG